MNTKSILLSTAITSLLAFGAVTTSQAADDHANQDKCFGISKAGENSCASNGHACQGQSKADKDPGEWKYVAKGSCAKMGGSATAGKKAS